METKLKFYPQTLWRVILHGFFTFGILTSLSILRLKYLGTDEIALLDALIIIGIIVGTVWGRFNFLTMKKCTTTENPVLN